jgi:hypothetical protein
MSMDHLNGTDLPGPALNRAKRLHGPVDPPGSPPAIRFSTGIGMDTPVRGLVESRGILNSPLLPGIS